MTAPVRRSAAVDSIPLSHREVAVDHWLRAVKIRQEWLTHGLSTQPADRDAAEQSLTNIYARISRTRPRFVWVSSPRQALPLLTGLPTHEVLQSWITADRPPGVPPLASDLAARVHRLRGALDERLTHPDLDPPVAAGRKSAQADRKVWPTLPPLDALAAGVPLRAVLRHGVWESLRTSLADGFFLPVRAALAAGRPLPVAWYGQQDASWIAFYDVMRRLGFARYRPEDDQHLDDWANLARTCGWWWPGERVCVVVERPDVVDTEPVPDSWYEQLRLRRGGTAAVEYRDGWRPPLGGGTGGGQGAPGRMVTAAPARSSVEQQGAGLAMVAS